MILRFTIFIFIGFFNSIHLFAFDSDGHKAIEKKAYELLRSYSGSGNIPDGITIISDLQKRSHILFDDNLETHSNYPDLSLERQFAQNRQMYHFMAL